MNRGEAIAILSGVGVTVLFVSWLIVGNIRARARVPERLVMPMSLLDGGPGIAIEVDGDPRLIEWKPAAEIPPEIAAQQLAGYARLFRRITLQTPLTDWEEDWEIEPTRPDRGDDPWPNVPPSGDSPWAHARPWAHG